MTSLKSAREAADILKLIRNVIREVASYRQRNRERKQELIQECTVIPNENLPSFLQYMMKNDANFDELQQFIYKPPGDGMAIIYLKVFSNGKMYCGHHLSQGFSKWQDVLWPARSWKRWVIIPKIANEGLPSEGLYCAT